MTSPVRHKETGIFQYRKRVPDHLRPIIGKREEKVSLKTRDPVEAKIAHARISAKIEARWRQLTAGVLTLSEKQAVAMAGDIYRELVGRHEDDPNRDIWEWGMSRLSTDQFFLRPTETAAKLIHLTEEGTDARQMAERMVENVRLKRNDPEIKAYLDRHGYRVDEPSMSRLRNAVAKAILQAREHLKKLSEGDYRPDPNADRFPTLDLTPKASDKPELGKYALTRIFEDYARESKRKPATVKKYKAIIDKVANEMLICTES